MKIQLTLLFTFYAISISAKPYNTEPPCATIPIVVHVVHDVNDPIGSGTNISDAQILSQISALNYDFNSVNIDSVPHVIRGNVDDDVNLKFELLSPSDIIRVPVSNSLLPFQTLSEVQFVSPKIDRLNYLHIWVTHYSLGDDTNGYALPLGILPPGHSSGTREWPVLCCSQGGFNGFYDGIVVNYFVFGKNSPELEPLFNLHEDYQDGHVTTHEVGHWLGLPHPYAINGDDCIFDTPCQTGSALEACTLTEAVTITTVCGGFIQLAMAQNYMNQPSDCALYFSRGQARTMRSTLYSFRPEFVCHDCDECPGLKNSCTGFLSGPNLPINIQDSYQSYPSLETQITELTSPINLQISPNPAINRLTASFELIEEARIIIDIYNTFGQVISQEDKGRLAQGKHQLESQIDLLPSGIYFYNIRVNEQLKSVRFVKQ